MQKAGLEKVEAAKQNGNWDKVIKPPEIEMAISKDFSLALDVNPKAVYYLDKCCKAN